MFLLPFSNNKPIDFGILVYWLYGSLHFIISIEKNSHSVEEQTCNSVLGCAPLFENHWYKIHFNILKYVIKKYIFIYTVYIQLVQIYKKIFNKHIKLYIHS